VSVGFTHKPKPADTDPKRRPQSVTVADANGTRTMSVSAYRASPRGQAAASRALNSGEIGGRHPDIVFGANNATQSQAEQDYRRNYNVANRGRDITTSRDALGNVAAIVAMAAAGGYAGGWSPGGGGEAAPAAGGGGSGIGGINQSVFANGGKGGMASVGQGSQGALAQSGAIKGGAGSVVPSWLQSGGMGSSGSSWPTPQGGQQRQQRTTASAYSPAELPAVSGVGERPDPITYRRLMMARAMGQV
jgi:hypothetical protein